METTDKKILVFGYGNPGRKDDGIGYEFIHLMEKWIADNNIKNIKTDCNYQLNIEDACSLAEHDITIFVDASEEEIEDFIVTRVEAKDTGVSYTSHTVSPESVLELCNMCYKKNPPTFLVHIKGYEWQFEESLTEQAHNNVMLAFHYIKGKIEKGDFNF